MMLFRILLVLWQLPQEILGFILSRGRVRHEEYGISYYKWKLGSSISLADFRILGDESVLFHEYGHSVQSLYLGPLYLIVIGLPSIVWCTIRSYTPLFRHVDYLSFYTERWAENLGRKKALRISQGR